MILTRNGVDINYEVHGKGQTTLLLTHGYSGSLRMWDPQVAALQANFRLVTWDLRGHGGSDSPERLDLYSAAHAVADMAALLDHLRLEQAVVGGLSLGGYLSLAFYLTHPDRVRALVLADTGPGYRNDEAREGWNEMARARGRFFSHKGLAGLEAGDPAHGDTHRSAMGLANAAAGTLVQHDGAVMAALPDVAVPSLIIVGSNDEPFVNPSQYMARKIPSSQLCMLDDAGHVSNIEQPDAFNAALVGFLADLA